MKAIILNSGIGSRMGMLTKNSHKSMVEIKDGITLIEHQIITLREVGIDNIVITTGYMESKIKEYLDCKFSDINIQYVYNPKYLETNYIYSIYLSLNKLDEDIVLLHGDLYFDSEILEFLIRFNESCVVVDTRLPLPEKDFKAQILGDRVTKIATYINGEDCISCQPLYKLKVQDFKLWGKQITKFCEEGKVNVYAEEALNQILDKIELRPLDIEGRLCMEVDTIEDLNLLKSKIETMDNEDGDLDG